MNSWLKPAGSHYTIPHVSQPLQCSSYWGKGNKLVHSKSNPLPKSKSPYSNGNSDLTWYLRYICPLISMAILPQLSPGIGCNLWEFLFFHLINRHLSYTERWSQCTQRIAGIISWSRRLCRMDPWRLQSCAWITRWAFIRGDSNATLKISLQRVQFSVSNVLGMACRFKLWLRAEEMRIQ